MGGLVCGWEGGEVVSFWDAGLRTGWAARGDTEVQEGPSRASIDEVSRKEQKSKKSRCRANNNGRSCDAYARTQANKACIFQILPHSTYSTAVDQAREEEGERERASEKDLTLASRSPCSKPPMPSPSAGGWIGGGWLMCAPTRPKTTQPWEQHSGIRLSPPHYFSFGRASLHPALPWIEGWRAEPGGTMRCPQRTSGRE